MAGAKNHDYHILQPDPRPSIGAFSALILASGGIMCMKGAAHAPVVFGIGVLCVLTVMYSWWSNVIREAHRGDHTPVVQLHLRYGMVLFIASEVMIFLGWFWAFFDFSLFPAPVVWAAASKSVSLVTVAAANPARAYKGDFTPRQHFGFEAAAWYWHFVDVVWLSLFVTIYGWGGWGAPT